MEERRCETAKVHCSKTSTSIRGIDGSHAPIFEEEPPAFILKAEAVDMAGVGDLPIGLPAVLTSKGRIARDVYCIVADALVPARI